MVLLGLVGLPSALAVCYESDCHQYPTDFLGRVKCPGSNPVLPGSGDCRRHYELAGGYGCCCGCPTK